MNDVKQDRSIELEDDQSAVVINGDGTVHLYLPGPGDDIATPSHLLATAIGFLLVEQPDVVMFALDTVIEDAQKHEESLSDTEEAKDDTVSGD